MSFVKKPKFLKKAKENMPQNNSKPSSSWSDTCLEEKLHGQSVLVADPKTELLDMAHRLATLALKADEAAFHQSSKQQSFAASCGEDPNMSLLIDRLSNWTISAADVRAEIARRRKRESFFTENLFADPAWDILLDLYAAELERSNVSISSACIAASVPQTTALRWIDMLIKNDLVERQFDKVDRRRTYLVLTSKGVKTMSTCLKSILFSSQATD